MRVGLLTDAACDLPAGFLAEQGVGIMPIHLHFGNRIVPDVHEVSTTLGFYRSCLADRDMPAETTPLSVPEMVECFKTLTAKYERAIFIPIGKTRSKIYENAVRAASAVGRISGSATHPEHHQNATDPFSIHVIDSQTLFTGQGILVYEAARALHQDMPYMPLIQYIQRLVRDVHSFLIPSDMHFLRTHARDGGDDSIDRVHYWLGTELDMKPIVSAWLGETEVIAQARGFEPALQQLIDMTVHKIEQRLIVPAVAVSYAGDPSVIAGKEMYRKFVAKAKRHGVEVMTSVMSPTGGINVGPGALALSYAGGYGNRI